MKNQSQKRAAIVLLLLTAAGSVLAVQAEEYREDPADAFAAEHDYDYDYDYEGPPSEEYWDEVYDDTDPEEGIGTDPDPGMDTDTDTDEEEEEGSGSGYSVPAGWSADGADGSDGGIVYREDAFENSTITCGYIDTNYSIQEYEQLRDMLTNNLLYEHVNAQISTSAVYTLAKDYLYIILVDDETEPYCDIYNYVVGDYCCFLVHVKEYRSEAEQALSQDLMTPREAGQSIAESFTWTG